MVQRQPSIVDELQAKGDREIPPRALGISVLALVAAGLGTWLQAAGEVRYFGLLWVLALIPPFMLSYYRGWRGAAVALGAGMVVLTCAEVGGNLLSGGTGTEWWVYAAAASILIAVSLGSGYSTSRSHRAGGELGRYADRLRALTDGVRSIHGHVELEERIREIAEQTREVMEASSVEVVLTDEEGDGYRRIRSGDEPPDTESGLFPTRRVLTAPLRDGRGREIGQIEVARRRSEELGSFDASDEALLGQMAEIASVGVQNARLWAELRTSEERYRTMADDVIDGSGVGVVIVGPGGRVVWTNRAVEEFFGLHRGEAVGERHERLLRSRLEPLIEDGREVREDVERAHEAGVEGFRRELLVRASSDGQRPERWLEHLSSPITSGLYEGGRIEHYTDVTERKRAERALAHTAAHDALTGLPNRKLFLDRVERLLEHSSRDPSHRFAVLFLDLDRFKLVNDSLGHQVGDRLLTAVGARLRNTLRSADTVARLSFEEEGAARGPERAAPPADDPEETVARLGGDEFAIVLHEISDDADAVRLARRVRSVLEDPFDVDGRTIHVTASIGIALSSRGYDAPETMLRDADMAMYRAKETGGDDHRVFDAGMHERLIEELDIETGLRHAIRRDELHLAYQPVYDLASGAMVGVEALLRWTHPERGEIPPARFLPVAETTGQIGRIGEWVLEEAIGALAGWTRRHPSASDLFLSVNLTPRQLVDGELSRQVERLVEGVGLETSRLVLEVTEDVLAGDAARGRERLEALRETGVRIALDDFGAGSFSLRSLARLPADMLKIDRSFAEPGPARSPILEAVRTLAASLDLVVVAEGIEDDASLDLAKDVGCTLGQGFLLARPMREEAVDRLLEEADGERDSRRGLELIS